MDFVDWIVVGTCAGACAFLGAVDWVQGQLLRSYRRNYDLQHELRGRLNQRVRELEHANRMLQTYIRNMPKEPGSEADWWKE